MKLPPSQKDDDTAAAADEDKIEGLVPSGTFVLNSTSTIISRDFCSKSTINQRKKIVLIGLLVAVVLSISYPLYLIYFSTSLKKKLENEVQSGGTDTANEEEYTGIIQTWNTIWDEANLSAPSALSLDLDDLLTMDAQQLFRTFPSPTSTNTLQIYNKKAYHDLIKIFLPLSPLTFQEQDIEHTPITVTAMGGSSTAGGGHVPQKHRYYEKFVDYIHELNLTASEVDSQRNKNFAIISRGHGYRHSLHSAVFASNFLPPTTDILFWEFAINDFTYNRRNIKKNENFAQMRSMMIAWLQEVQKMQPKPPKVLLIYLWKSPFQQKQDGNVNNPVFDAHILGTKLAAQFDFVVGHINLASYFDELTTIPTPSSGSGILLKNKTISFQDVKNLFLADIHHPNSLGHLVISFLLLNFVRGEGKWSDSSSSPTGTLTSSSVLKPISISMGGSIQAKSRVDHNSTVKRERYKWFCGNETFDKQFIRDRIVDESDTHLSSALGWRSPIATLTLEKPQNQHVVSSFPLKLVVESKSYQSLLCLQTQCSNEEEKGGIYHPRMDDGLKILGKQDPLRVDRIKSVALPCCLPMSSRKSTQHEKRNFRDLRISNVNHSAQMDTVRAMFLGFAKDMSNVDKLKVFMEWGDDGKRTPVSGKLIKVPHNWPCFWTWTDVYDSFWFTFLDEEDQQRNFTSLSICVENSQCKSIFTNVDADTDTDTDTGTETDADQHSGAALISMALYS